MDSTLKRRLIGATILVAIAAIVLPMFLSGPRPGPTRGTTLPLEIPPSPDREMQSVTVPIDGSDAADPDHVVAVDTGATGTTSMPTLPPVNEPVVADTGADANTAAEPETESEAEMASAAVAAASPSTGTATTTPPAAASQTPSATPDGRFWINLGSYGQSANADRVAQAARSRNVTVERETVGTNGRQLIRLRAGPYATRAQAEQARQLLIAAVPDAKPSIDEASRVPTTDTPAPATGAPAATTAGAWAVQVGAFDQEANARQLSERLKGAGFPAFVERRGASFAVRVGPYVRRADAEAQRQQLKSGQRLDGLVVSHAG